LRFRQLPERRARERRVRSAADRCVRQVELSGPELQLNASPKFVVFAMAIFSCGAAGLLMLPENRGGL